MDGETFISVSSASHFIVNILQHYFCFVDIIAFAAAHIIILFNLFDLFSCCRPTRNASPGKIESRNAGILDCVCSCNSFETPTCSTSLQLFRYVNIFFWVWYPTAKVLMTIFYQHEPIVKNNQGWKSKQTRWFLICKSIWLTAALVSFALSLACFFSSFFE